MKVSEKMLVKAPQEDIFEFLSVMSNHRQLMPQDFITDWYADNNTCSFKLKNMLRVDLKISNRVPNTLLQAVPSKETPVAIEIQWDIKAINSEESDVVYSIEADINLMMQVMAKPILTQLVKQELENLAQIMNR